ncbi:hypothetical protein I551_5735 [Mycobacterium ulcerans str. Harvey]|uniref:Uncharacterized protein n=1 Tax=Mycobacterium ulcerans str. Harvey TaxID=1299332 RepID=A0ABP3ADE2_MYCUL|nr:hypothetical protein I551_5735 [Mycobacterium ulcerans str. Harvey]
MSPKGSSSALESPAGSGSSGSHPGGFGPLMFAYPVQTDSPKRGAPQLHLCTPARCILTVHQNPTQPGSSQKSWLTGH